MKFPKKNQSRKELKIKEIAITKMRIKFNKKKIKIKLLGMKLKNKIQLEKRLKAK
jgi:hypothetical protein